VLCVTQQEAVQVVDVQVVDVLAHLEALLRSAHTLQRAALKLRSEAPPPNNPATYADRNRVVHDIRHQVGALAQTADSLSRVIEDLGRSTDDLAHMVTQAT
jgi:hypothetical protein